MNASETTEIETASSLDKMSFGCVGLQSQSAGEVVPVKMAYICITKTCYDDRRQMNELSIDFQRTSSRI